MPSQYSRVTRRPVETIRRDESGTTIKGYAAVFYRKDDPGTEYQWLPGVVHDRIARACFEKAIQRHDDSVCLFNHDKNLILGRVSAGTLRLSVDDVGLAYECDLPETSYARDLLASLGRGDVCGSSFSGDPEFRFERAREADIRWVESIELADVGPVTFPAFEATSAAIERSRSAEAGEAVARYEAFTRRLAERDAAYETRRKHLSL